MTNLLFVIAVKFILLLFMLLTNVLWKEDTKSTGTDNFWSEIVRDKVASESNQNHCKRGQRSMQCCHNFTRLNTNYTTYKSGFWLKIRGIGMFKSCFCNIQPTQTFQKSFCLDEDKRCLWLLKELPSLSHRCWIIASYSTICKNYIHQCILSLTQEKTFSFKSIELAPHWQS